MTTLYRVCWSSREHPEQVLRGNPISLKAAEAKVTRFNKEYPTLRHWVEEERRAVEVKA